MIGRFLSKRYMGPGILLSEEDTWFFSMTKVGRWEGSCLDVLASEDVLLINMLQLVHNVVTKINYCSNSGVLGLEFLLYRSDLFIYIYINSSGTILWHYFFPIL